MSVTYLDLKGVLALHDIAIGKYGGKPGVINLNGIESCLAQPQQIICGEELFPSLSDKAAAYLFYIATAQNFVEGNKRTALLCCKIFLHMNGHRLTLSEGDEEQLVMNVAEKTISLDELKTLISSSVSQVIKSSP